MGTCAWWGPKFSTDPWFAACINGTAPPPAPPVPLEDPSANAPPPKPPPPPEPAKPAPCHAVSAYIEPSVFVAVGTPGVGELQRVAAGLTATSCDSPTSAGLSMRVGGTFSLRIGKLGFGPNSGTGGSGLYAAGGGEVEIDGPLGGSRIGVRLGIDSYDGNMVTAGVRWRYGHVGAGADAFYSRGTRYDPG